VRTGTTAERIDPSITHPLDHGLTGDPNVPCQGETSAGPYLVKGSASGATHHTAGLELTMQMRRVEELTMRW